jgi:hypothetical protein
LGHRRGRIGNEGGFQEDTIADYTFAGTPEEGYFYSRGRWAATAEYMESVEAGANSLLIRYQASGVNLVMASPRGPECNVTIRQDGAPLTTAVATTDVLFTENGSSFIRVQQPRMYRLVDNRSFAFHELELICPAGLAAFAFTFTSCVEPQQPAIFSESIAI